MDRQPCRAGVSAQAISRPGRALGRKYTPADVALLVEMDRANENVCGPAIAHLLQRAHAVCGDLRYERLADLRVRTCTTCANAPTTGRAE